MKPYKRQMIIAIVCILISAVVSAVSSMFLETLIDDYITPLLGSSSPVFTGLLQALGIMAVIYLSGVIATLFYNRIMVTVAQETLKSIRDQMFGRMQKLPIRYFDTHSHGDIMSLYTNDTDTLRQMIAQSLSQMISSVFTIVAVFVCMLMVSIQLTVLVCATLVIILAITKKLTGKIASESGEQQTSLATLNGYVEEMVNGQKVVKVFNHEQQCRDQLRAYNRDWEKHAENATGMSNAVMPMLNALGYMQYVLIAILGGYMAIRGTGNLTLTGFNTLTLGMIASFLTLSRNFN
ncbi:MAG: ABC transporter ATP-binding protein, partial [Bulleidia sp.]